MSTNPRYAPLSPTAWRYIFVGAFALMLTWNDAPPWVTVIAVVALIVALQFLDNSNRKAT